MLGRKASVSLLAKSASSVLEGAAAVDILVGVVEESEGVTGATLRALDLFSESASAGSRG